ncbi:MAG: FKBP-type peptidyl-prolyl cis-trans isomerase [Synechococcus sp.]
MTQDTVTTLSSDVLRRSKGAVVSDTDTLLVFYQGTLLSGEQFDANFDFTNFEPVPGRQAFEFILGAGQVIEGWDKGLVGQRVGSVIELTIPADQAYGEAGSGDRIPPNSPLMFKVEVLAMLPAGSSEPIFSDYKDLGINTEKIGLTEELIDSTTGLKIGLDGADSIQGGKQADLLIGLKGKDQLTGGRGADVLLGGKSKDTFQYLSVKESPAVEGKSDHLLDFGRRDKIDLQELGDELQFIGRDPFSGTAGDLRFSAGRLELDQDGDGSADFALLMPGTKTLKATNLIL